MSGRAHFVERILAIVARYRDNGSRLKEEMFSNNSLVNMADSPARAAHENGSLGFGY